MLKAAFLLYLALILQISDSIERANINIDMQEAIVNIDSIIYNYEKMSNKLDSLINKE